MRTLKKDYLGVKTDFEYDGDKLIYQNNSDGRLDFLYDENGELYGFIKDSQDKYFYVRDCLKNILGIVDISGNLVVKYSNDAYGKCTLVSDTSNAQIGRINPFRFKGYYFDSETGFYYCNSRYYVPEWGRWLTSDLIEYLDPTSVNGMNLYAYCNNDPITYLDNAGNFAVKYSSDSVKLRSLMSIINIPGFDEVSYTNTALDAFLKIAGNVLKHIGRTMYRQNVIADTILVGDKGVVNQLTLLNNSLATNIMNYGSLSTNLSSTFSNLGKVLFVAGLAIDVYNDVTDPSLSAEQKIALTVSDVCFQGAIFALSCFLPVSAIIGIAALCLYRKYLRDDIKELTR